MRVFAVLFLLGAAVLAILLPLLVGEDGVTRAVGLGLDDGGKG